MTSLTKTIGFRLFHRFSVGLSGCSQSDGLGQGSAAAERGAQRLPGGRAGAAGVKEKGGETAANGEDFHGDSNGSNGDSNVSYGIFKWVCY